jgi:hypothetical protein
LALSLLYCDCPHRHFHCLHNSTSPIRGLWFFSPELSPTFRNP